MIKSEMLSIKQKNTIVPIRPKSNAQFALSLDLSELLLSQIGHTEEREIRDEAKLLRSGVPRGAEVLDARIVEAQIASDTCEPLRVEVGRVAATADVEVVAVPRQPQTEQRR